MCKNCHIPKDIPVHLHEVFHDSVRAGKLNDNNIDAYSIMRHMELLELQKKNATPGSLLEASLGAEIHQYSIRLDVCKRGFEVGQKSRQLLKGGVG